MNKGGVGKGAGVIAISAALAAIMSTADSLLIAISHLLTMELVAPLVPNATANRLTWYARFVSTVSVAIAITFGLSWKKGITDLGAIQFPLSTQAVPAFLLGLYCTSRKADIHPWSIVAGAVTSTIYVVGFYFGYLRVAEAALPINAGITGLILNVVVIYSTEMLRKSLDLDIAEPEEKETDQPALMFPDRPTWDVPDLTRFGKRALTPKRIWKQMEGVPEPLTNPWCVFLFFFSITMVTPLTPEHEPPLINGTFAYLPAIVNGVPWWFFKLILLSFIPTAILLTALYQMPAEFPEKKVKTVDRQVIKESDLFQLPKNSPEEEIEIVQPGFEMSDESLA